MTTKTGDSGSAGTPGEKCVMKEALKFDTKIDQKHVNQQKMIKNHQNHKIIKMQKMRKSEKVTKCENTKSDQNAKS